MHSEAVVLLQSDPVVSRNLVSALAKIFRTVCATDSMTDALHAARKHKARIAILDMESVSSQQIGQILDELPLLRIVCTHRLADDELWMTALNVGAADCCLSSDTTGIINAVLRDREHVAAA